MKNASYLSIILGGTAAALIASQPALCQEAARQEFHLPSQGAAASLLAIGRQTNREIFFHQEDVRTVVAPALNGAYTAEEAVRAVLEGSGLRIEIRNGSIFIRGRSPVAAPSVVDAPSNADIVVTGSHIRGAKSASPLIVSTRKSLEDAGITDMAGFSRIIPQNFTGGQNPGVAGVSDQGGQSNINNSTTLNLRGLGADATLTLINGHRLAYDALLQGVDVSAIPLEAIQRVEIIADGASAIYGSDAVGGVANIILRRDYSGVRTAVRLGGATDGGDFQQQYTGVTGMRWRQGGFIVTADYSRTSPIYASQRTYTEQLSPAQMLKTGGSQFSAVLAGHQEISDAIEFELDGQFADRHVRKTTAYKITGGPTVNGQINTPTLNSFAITPRLRFQIGDGWTSTLQGTKSISKTIVNSRGFSNSVETGGRGLYKNRLTNIEASAEGKLFQLPGGAARLAFGGGYRSFGLNIRVSKTAKGVTTISRDGTERRSSLFAYGELSVPIVGPENRRPLLEALQISAALRYERYNHIGDVTTPKLGLVYSPVPSLTLKASWGRSYKIPTLDQTNQIVSGGLLPGSLFAPQPTPPLANNATVLVLSGGNRDLKPERAATWTATMEFRPKFVSGLTLTTSYFDIDYRNRIGVPISDTLSVLANPVFANAVTLSPSIEQVNDIVASLPQTLVNATGRPFVPSDVGAILDARLRNTARERARGADVAANYQIDLGPQQKLLMIASATYLDASQQIIKGQQFVDRSGVIFTAPKWRARAGGNWQDQNIQISAVLNYIGGVKDNRLAFLGQVAPFTTLDISARVGTGIEKGYLKGVEFRLSVLNVLNNKPALIGTSDPAAIPFDSINQSAVGRFISVGVAKKW
jgi:outer membrane receptor protein involved in Fe transport